MFSPKVTIGIASYNRASFLPAALQSALAQETSVPFEVLICDDVSTDGTREFLSSIQDSRIRILLREKNGGESAVRNQMVSEAKGEFVIWLDDDDILLPHALKSHMAFIEKHPEADIVSANLQFVDENLVPRVEYLKYRQISSHLVLYRLLVDNMLANGGTLIRKTVFDRVGPYNEEMPRSLDYEFWARCALKHCRFFHNDDFIYLYRAHGGNCMNPREQDPEHHIQYARVAAKIVNEGIIEEIFPMFDWQSDPEGAAAQSLLITSLVFLKWEQYTDALSTVSQSASYRPSKEAEMTKAIVLRAMGEVEKSCDTLLKLAFSEQDTPLFNYLQMSSLNVYEDFSSLLAPLQS